MSLSIRDSRVLAGIEGNLASSEPQLAALYKTFNRVSLAEPMPSLERITRRRSRLLAILLLPLMLASGLATAFAADRSSPVTCVPTRTALALAWPRHHAAPACPAKPLPRRGEPAQSGRAPSAAAKPGSA